MRHIAAHTLAAVLSWGLAATACPRMALHGDVTTSEAHTRHTRVRTHTRTHTPTRGQETSTAVLGATGRNGGAATQEGDDNVVVGFYVEALCPFCRASISDGVIYHIMSDPKYEDLFQIMDVVLVPWGNARENRDGSFTCQHGPAECTANAYELCALTLLGGGNVSSISTGIASRDAWPFIHCLETSGGDPSDVHTVNVCVTKSEGLKFDDLLDCVKHRYHEVQHEGAVATDALCHQPGGCHQWVPWTTVDGRIDVWANGSSPEDADEVATVVCKQYQGPANNGPSLCERDKVHREKCPSKE